MTGWRASMIERTFAEQLLVSLAVPPTKDFVPWSVNDLQNLVIRAGIPEDRLGRVGIELRRLERRGLITWRRELITLTETGLVAREAAMDKNNPAWSCSW